MIELGGSIELTGFSELDSAELIILKKIIGNYARKFSDSLENYEKLVLNLKSAKGKNKFEVQGRLLIKGKPVNADVTDVNLFMAVAETLKKLENQAIKV